MNSMMTLKCVISVDGPKPCVIPFMWYFDEGKPSVQKRAGGCLQMAVGERRWQDSELRTRKAKVTAWG